MRLFGLVVAIALVFISNAIFGDHHAPLAAEADKDLPPLPTVLRSENDVALCSLYHGAVGVRMAGSVAICVVPAPTVVVSWNMPAGWKGGRAAWDGENAECGRTGKRLGKVADDVYACLTPTQDLPPPVGPERCQWAMAHGYIFDGEKAGCSPDQHLK